MGTLVDGVWQSANDNKIVAGRFQRSESRFRGWLSPDGDAGPNGEPGHRAEAGRYRLYVALSCPWAHRALLMRAFKGLDDLLPISVVHWLLAEDGWTFSPGPGVVADPVMGASALHQLYSRADPLYTGRVTVPMLWDCHAGSIVSNESAEIVRMLNSAFDDLGAEPCDFYPTELRVEIDGLNDRIYRGLNNAVYRAGFTTSQEAYEEAVDNVFETLDWLEQRLSRNRWLTGDRLTEADVRLFPTLIRFDAVYNLHFKCNVRRIADYPRLSAYTREFYALPNVARTVDFDHIKRGYYQSHRQINPAGIVPAGPEMSFAEMRHPGTNHNNDGDMISPSANDKGE